ncbi:MAG TPA: type VI secretion system baseplate subunit TssF [Devosia sp.]|nr:type VI secretion system baseplate subunit TssF [Devosia sp.]
MNTEFRDHYETELRLLYEHARHFAAEYPGIADRLGGLEQDLIDPGMKALLEGSAYMAARVQLKLKSEFGEFTTALLEQFVPNYLAPLPSFVLVEARPAYDNPNLRKGLRFEGGSTMDAVYVERERRVSCRYTLGSALTLWPLRLETAQYHAGPAALQALGLEVLPGTAAGLRLSFQHRITAPESDVAGTRPLGAPVNTMAIDELPIHLIGNATDSDALYEQLFAHCRRITLRYEDAGGDPRFIPLSPDTLQQLGFEPTDALLPDDQRVFAGFETLREFFSFPDKFTGFRLTGLQAPLRNVPANGFELIFEFDAAVTRLAPVVSRALFALYAAPAVNLFEMACARIPLDGRNHEHQIVPDRSRWLDYEVHRVIDVFAHYQGRKDKVKVFPLYSLPTSAVRLADALYYAFRRLPRQPTESETRFGRQASYAGTETYLTFTEAASIDAGERARELSVRALVSNRHLTEHLPVGDSGADFHLTDDTSLALKCIAGPTPPRESLVLADRKQRAATASGPALWRLINILSFNHLGLTNRSADDRAGGLREVLALFADLSDAFTERQVRGIVNVQTRPVVRRLRQANGFNAARGMEVTITFDEKNYAGGGIMVLGAVLDRFLCQYTAINSFTQTVIASTSRGVVMTWPPRSGQGGPL